MNFMIQNIDLIIFAIGMLLINCLVFFIKTDNDIVLKIADYFKNFNVIYISYLIIAGLILGLTLGLKIISVCTVLFSSANKIGPSLSCLLLSPMTFFFFFVFFLIIQFVVYLLLSSKWIKLNTNIKNIVFVVMSFFSVCFIGFLNNNLSKLHKRRMTIVFIDALPLQNAAVQNTKLENYQ